MKRHLLHVCLLVCTLFLSCLARGQSYSLPVSGPVTACVGNTTSYNVPSAPGIQYYWTVTAGGTETSVNPVHPATFIWTAAGTCTITVVGQNAAGHHVDSGIKVVTVYAIPQPTITTTTRVACQTLDSLNTDSASTGGNILNDADGCIKVCEHSKVKYTAHGPLGSTFSWSVVGGTISGSSTGSSVTVIWGGTGPGSITLVDHGPGGCTGTVTICIDIIEKPHASFNILPHPGPVSVYTACLDATLVFHDLSTASPSSPIVNWFWFFGDGTTSSMENPTHHYASAGSYIVSLVVTNACGCTDTFKTRVNVLTVKGPDIECPAVVCQNETATYTTGATCSTYNWVVTGGIILSGAGTNTIVVKWGTGGATGFGYVNLAVSGCGLCPAYTSIKVPIIQSNPIITGPANPICTHKPYQYELPLWPGTQYDWGVISFPGAVIDGRNNNIVTLEFAAPGTYVVHVWWQNRLTLCGGDKKFTVVVVDPPTIVGPTTLCSTTTATPYTLSTGASASWTLSGPGGYVQTGTGTSFPALFPAAGTYHLSATGASFCPPDELTITVPPTPPPATAISGPVQVCLGQPYTYTATVATGGYNFHWAITGGTLSATTGNSVTVVWSSAGTISVVREGAVAPHCTSTPISLSVTPFPLTPHITGPTTVCANTYSSYTDNYTIADATTWQIIPSTTGSVVTGTYSPNMTVLWNNITTGQFATIVVTIRKCDSIRTDSLRVWVNPSAPVTISPVPSTVCNTNSIVFTAPLGAATYTWDFGDGTSTVTSSNTVSHPFTTSVMGTTPIPYTVSVTTSGTGSGGTCPLVGTSSTVVHVIPGPYASISTPDPTFWCIGDPIAANLSAVVTNTTGTTVGYQWYLNGILISGATNPVYAATTDGAYTLVVTDGSTCSATSNVLNINTVICTSGGGSGFCSGPPTISMTSSLSCNTITSTGFGTGGTPTWIVSPGYTTETPSGYTNTVTYPNPGYYEIIFRYIYPGCIEDAHQIVTVPVVGHFRYDWSCSTGGNILQLHDISALLAGFNNTTTGSVSWSITPVGGGTTYTSSGINYSVTLPPGTYNVTETVVANPDAGTGPSGTCVVTQVITVAAPTTVGFTAAPLNICEGIPVNFTPVIGGGSAIGSYSWSFGDGATSLVTNPARTYTWGASASHIFIATLTVVNSLGCSYTSTPHSITIHHNNMLGTVSGPTLSCGAPVALSYLPTTGGTPASYLWSNGPATATDVVTVTGAYFVTVKNSFQCRYVTAPHNVSILSSIPLVITGRSSYCQGEAVVLTDYVGTDYTYQWYNGSGPIAGATAPQLTIAGLPAGTYNYHIVVTHTYATSSGSITCSQTSPVFTVTVHATPPPPTISGPFVLDCALYSLQLNASSSISSPTFNWSDGNSGPVDIINHGGGYRVWLTDMYGCQSHADKNVPLSPSSYMGWFPAGCYNFCNTYLGAGGLMLYGPPGVFNSWGWLFNGIVTSGGYMSGIAPLPISSPGNYQLTLYNGLCSATSDAMTVAEKDCKECRDVILIKPTPPSIACDPVPGDPAGYIVTVTLFNPSSTATTFTLGMDIGPMVPFSVTIPAGTASTFTFHFTTLAVPPPVNATLWVRYTMPDGQECYSNFVFKLPICTWLPERNTAGGNAEVDAIQNVQQAPTAMLVYPNPANNIVNVSYNYGDAGSTDRRIVVYDVTGRKVANEKIGDVTGTFTMSLDNLAAGSYIIRMEDEGRAVHTEHLSVTH